MRIIINIIVVKRNINTIIPSITKKFGNRHGEEAKKKRRGDVFSSQIIHLKPSLKP